MAKIRADILLVEQGLCESRSQAQRLILAGKVRVGSDHVVRNASEKWPEETKLSVDEPLQYVSRGAGKLKPALLKHKPDLAGCIGLDVGASTGGFTDLMLQQGAEKVYAVDVGTNQLHYKLRQDPRVICLEQTNARYLTSEQIPDRCQLMTCDVSFISVTKILPAAAALLAPDAWAFILIKPQFEAERDEIQRGGVVKDPAIRQRVVDSITGFADTQLGWKTIEVLPSTVLGPKGNQEFVAVFNTGHG